MALSIAEVSCLGLADGYPSLASPFLYTAPLGAGHSQRVTPLAVLVEPCESWRGAAASAACLVARVVRAMTGMSAAHVPAQLDALLASLNSDEYERRRDASRRSGAVASGFGVVCAVLSGSDLFVAQLPPGQFVMRQITDVYALPSDSDDPDTRHSFDAHDLLPLGRAARVAPRLFSTRAASGDVVMLASSMLYARAPRSARELSSALPDDALTEIGAAAERARLRDGVLGIIRLG
jgi:hypothetical protein